MISNIYLDIETIPGDTFYQRQVASAIRPPATYTKPESITQWMIDKAPAAMDEAIHKTGLMPAYSSIVCLAWAFEYEEIVSYSGPEKTILVNFFADLADRVQLTQNGYAMRFIGHNIIPFDLPCIWWACLRNDVPYAFLPHPRKVKPWETMTACDTLYQLAGTDRKGMGLGNMAQLFGIPDEFPDIDGSMVWQMYKDGRHSEIEEYCRGDVRIARELYRWIREWI